MNVLMYSANIYCARTVPGVKHTKYALLKYELEKLQCRERTTQWKDNQISNFSEVYEVVYLGKSTRYYRNTWQKKCKTL